MKKLLLLFALLLLTVCMHAQQLSQIVFSKGADFSSFGFLTDQAALIRLSEDGKIIEWGKEVKALNYDVYAPQLQPFPGRVDYYGSEADSVSRGKVKNIGTCVITYYGAYETPEKVGKIKSIGSLSLDYFSQYENTGLKGKIKQAGTLMLDYYGAYENEMIRGKLKTVGNNSIVYHTSFDDKFIRGKIKSVGGVSYNWYTSLDPGGAGGALKSPSYRQNINGVIYIIR
jgi:hypothetical protein